jgi:predicted TIM-barrel fold metal-dependent hydrolase
MASVMRYSDWLRHQVERLEAELRDHHVFASDAPATERELRELREKVVLHTYLRQQLLRRDPVRITEPEYDTEEFILVPRA